MSEFVAEALEDCDEGCSMALEIMSDFLTVEKLAAGMFTLEKVNTELVPYLQKAIKMFNSSADAKSVTISLTPRGGGSDSAFVADIDPLKMNNVLRNLLSNAVKFSKVGGCVNVMLDIVPSETSGDPDNVLITVTDDGAGISPENIERLFTEGVQFNANTLQAGGGSGFGLYIAAGIVELHGGRIWAESEGEGKGTKFLILVPVLASIHEGPPPGPVSKQASLRPARQVSRDTTVEAFYDGPKLKVVIVDDSHMNRKMMSSMLAMDGHECLQAEDGLAAVELMAGRETGENAVDAILMDNNMPRMSGPSAIMEIRRRGFKGVILGVSGDALSIDKFTDAGANGTLLKPIIREELLDAIALHLVVNRV
jgi:two-component system CheB/CheR fusion protein